MQPHIYQLSEKAIVVEWEQRIDPLIAANIRQLQERIHAQHFPWLEETVPAYASLTIFYNPLIVLKSSLPGQRATALIETCLLQLLKNINSTTSFVPPQRKEIPVCYGGEYGPDLSLVATHCGVSEEAVVSLHSNAMYQVYMIGFVPGFAYMGGMSEKLATPRRETPRPKVPAGAVGIAGQQTGIYPIEISGGWQIIGRTPLSLFNVEKNPPALLKAGDEVIFIPVSRFSL